MQLSTSWIIGVRRCEKMLAHLEQRAESPPEFSLVCGRRRGLLLLTCLHPSAEREFRSSVRITVIVVVVVAVVMVVVVRSGQVRPHGLRLQSLIEIGYYSTRCAYLACILQVSGMHAAAALISYISDDFWGCFSGGLVLPSLLLRISFSSLRPEFRPSSLVPDLSLRGDNSFPYRSRARALCLTSDRRRKELRI